MDRHVFLALPLSAEAKKKLAEVTQTLKDKVPMKKWVHHEDYHLTLVFLGNAREEALNKLKEMLSTITASPLTLEIDSIGSFGRAQKPRILWAGVARNAALEELQKKVSEMCRECGFIIEERPFAPHITLARSYINDAPPLQYDVSDLWPIRGTSISVPQKEFVLFETKVGMLPKYHRKETFQLNYD
ncbi:RNA 2',3'-cyclic phosphodiesterase [Fictibacillus aquaticus]|uniref:RNA 2',3'-cyclic phosphodiesterase n=1 Tax=Fictibacillus aquaticus TaxID=2021314 RepID=A0A235FA94_9BACL|nr:RNA 2',3'-cyclic phosphodiesterase [Fictibacillus aquaticus]OYD58261.1 RNA 2',3'-cyclic phosphodiesterase [Fictibacillus aquaticus]